MPETPSVRPESGAGDPERTPDRRVDAFESLDADDVLMCVPSMDAVVSRWFRSYAEARASLESEGGYLLPYRSQFFVTSREAIRELGLDPDDPDWTLIGWDWVRPRDRSAWERLRDRRLVALGRPRR